MRGTANPLYKGSIPLEVSIQMKNTKQWLETIKSSKEKLNHWLKRQYVGESLAALRIQVLANTSNQHKEVLSRIALDEAKHRDWIKELLVSRNISTPEISYTKDKYWKEILPNIKEHDDLFAAGYHAETMRLERINAIVEDQEIDSDIRSTFENIKIDEEYHAKVFKDISSQQAKDKTMKFHQKGMENLGLLM